MNRYLLTFGHSHRTLSGSHSSMYSRYLRKLFALLSWKNFVTKTRPTLLPKKMEGILKAGYRTVQFPFSKL